jgi:hypothetical protein
MNWLDIIKQEQAALRAAKVPDPAFQLAPVRLPDPNIYSGV